MPSPYVDIGLGAIEHLEDAPEYPVGDLREQAGS
jgi:hypothetical protein